MTKNIPILLTICAVTQSGFACDERESGSACGGSHAVAASSYEHERALLFEKPLRRYTLPELCRKLEDANRTITRKLCIKYKGNVDLEYFDWSAKDISKTFFDTFFSESKNLDLENLLNALLKRKLNSDIETKIKSFLVDYKHFNFDNVLLNNLLLEKKFNEEDIKEFFKDFKSLTK